MNADVRPAFLIVQGRLKAGADNMYTAYLAGTRPLFARYGVEIVAVGEGVPNAHTTDAWPINAVLQFPSIDELRAFLSDPAYLEIKTAFRDKAYETLHLSIFLGRPPRVL